ncbi:hypothetical protein GCM10029992_61870 [Glycomyces albus]
MGAVADRFGDGLDQLRLLGVGGGRRLTGGAVEDQAVEPLLVDEVPGELGGSGDVEFARGREGRDHGRQGAPEGRVTLRMCFHQC